MKRNGEILQGVMRKGNLKNMTLTRHIKVKKSRGRQRESYLTRLSKSIIKRKEGMIVNKQILLNAIKVRWFGRAMIDDWRDTTQEIKNKMSIIIKREKYRNKINLCVVFVIFRCFFTSSSELYKSEIQSMFAEAKDDPVFNERHSFSLDHRNGGLRSVVMLYQFGI